MKRRTFFFTLLLFLLFFHGAILTVTVVSLRERMDTARQQGLAAHGLLMSALLGDMQALEERNTPPERAIAALVDSYAGLYRSAQGRLAVYQGEQPLCGNIEEETLAGLAAAAPGSESRTLTFQTGEAPALLVTGRLPEPYGEYVLFYQADMAETLAGWRQMKNLLFLAAALFSLLLAGSLLLLFHRLFRPLEQVSAASRTIAGGDYSHRLPEAGSDELAGMARSFNQMAQEIQNQMKALQAAAAQKQRFVDNFAHELRTPLTAIYGYAEYLQRAALSPEDIQAATGYILSECRRLQNMAGQLLELATASGGEIPMGQVELGPLFAAVQAALAPQAARRQVALRFAQELESLWGSRELLESLLINLAENALRACEPGGKVLVQAALDKKGAPTLLVQDNGRGMTKEQLAHVREAFYRVDKARSRREGGAGLGLALCEQIAKVHGARFVMDSAPGAGTTALVTFTTP